MTSKYTVEQQIQRSKDIHGEGTYDYSLFTEYKSNKLPYTLICTKHNESFSVSMNDHLGKKQSGCPICGRENKKQRKSERTFKALQQQVDDKYGIGLYKVVEQNRDDYPSDLYIDIVCTVHGVFKKTIHEFAGRKDRDCQGCPKCLVESRRTDKKVLSELIEQRRKENNVQYDYSLINLDNFKTLSDPVKIICPIHGVFDQAFDAHFKYGQSCRKCSHTYTSSQIQDFLSTLKGPYSFDKVKLKYIKGSSKVKDLTIKNIYCQTHDVYFDKSYTALQSAGCTGCRLCISETCSKALSGTTEEFIEKAQQRHGNKFDYSLVAYKNNTTDVKVICPTHGVFDQTPMTHLTSKLCCPICVRRISSSELEVLDFIKTLISETDIETNKRYSWLNKKELDIYIPKYNLAVEYNGSAFHHSSKSEFISSFKKQTSKPPTYHFDKWKMCFDNDITLLSIYDFYWADENKKEIIKSKIRHYLWLDKKIYARKTYIKELDNATAYKFYDSNHLEGKGMAYKSAKSYGLYSKEDDTLLMCATVGEIYNQSSKSFKTKLHRICTLLDYTVIGGISKLAKHIKSDIGKSFTYQITLSSGGTSLKSVNSYKILPPRYFWVGKNGKGFIYHHRNYCQKQVLEKHFGVPLLKQDTENTYMERLGYLKVYDNGLAEIEM